MVITSDAEGGRDDAQQLVVRLSSRLSPTDLIIRPRHGGDVCAATISQLRWRQANPATVGPEVGLTNVEL